MGFLGDLGKELAGEFIDGALEGIGLKGLRQDLQKLSNNLKTIQSPRNASLDSFQDFSNEEKLYGMAVSFLYFLSDSENEGNDSSNPQSADEQTVEQFFMVICKGLLFLNSEEDNPDSLSEAIEKTTSLLDYTLKQFFATMQKQNNGNDVFETLDVFNRSELGLKVFLKFANKFFPQHEVHKSITDIFTALNVVLLFLYSTDENTYRAAKVRTKSSYFRYYILANQLNLSNRELLEIGQRLWELPGSSPSFIKSKINRTFSIGCRLFEGFKKLPRNSQKDELYSNLLTDDFGDLEECLKEATIEAEIKTIAFIISRKKEILPGEIAFIKENASDLGIEQENLEDRIFKEAEVIKESEHSSEYLTFLDELRFEDKQELLVLDVLLAGTFIFEKVGKGEKASPNYAYNFILIKNHMHFSNKEFSDCLHEAEFPEEQLELIEKTFSNQEIDYIRETFPEICDPEDIERAERRKEQEKKQQIKQARKEHASALREYVGTLYNQALENDCDDYLASNIIEDTTKYEAETQKALSSYGQDIGKDGTENILIVYNSDALNPFIAGFILTDKKIYVRETKYDEPHSWNLEEIKEITVKKGLLFCTLKVNEITVDSSIAKKYFTQAEQLIEMMKKVIAHCLGKDISQ